MGTQSVAHKNNFREDLHRRHSTVAEISRLFFFRLQVQKTVGRAGKQHKVARSHQKIGQGYLIDQSRI